MSYRWCRRCSQGKCSRLRHWHIKCRTCRRLRIFRGPSCKPCLIEAKALVADMFAG